MGDGIKLKTVIEQLRAELGELAEAARGKTLQFEVESVEIELRVGVKNEVGRAAKATFWVLELGADEKHPAEQTQTMKLKLSLRSKENAEATTELRIGRSHGREVRTDGREVARQPPGEKLIRRSYGETLTRPTGRVGAAGEPRMRGAPREVYVVFPREVAEVAAASSEPSGAPFRAGLEARSVTSSLEGIVERLRGLRDVDLAVGDEPRPVVVAASASDRPRVEATLLPDVGVLLVEGDDAIEALLRNDPEVGAVVASSTVVATIPDCLPTQANGPSRWHLEHVGAHEAHARNLRGRGRWIGIADSGLVATHPEFKGKHVSYRAFDAWGRPRDGAAVTDLHGHGTHVAGIAAGCTVGVAPDSNLAIANVLPNGSGTLAQIFAGLNWLASVERGDGRKGVDVINLSMEIYTPRDAATPRAVCHDFEPVVRVLRARGIEVVAAIGNSGPGRLASPGNLRDVLGVGAVDVEGNVWAKSCAGQVDDGAPSKPDLLAPGVAVFSAGLDGGYVCKNGTSMAAPVVSGLVALLLEELAEVSKVRPALMERARKLHARF